MPKWGRIDQRLNCIYKGRNYVYRQCLGSSLEESWHVIKEQQLYHMRTIAKIRKLFNYLIINSFTNWHFSSY